MASLSLNGKIMLYYLPWPLLRKGVDEPSLATLVWKSAMLSLPWCLYNCMKHELEFVCMCIRNSHLLATYDLLNATKKDQKHEMVSNTSIQCVFFQVVFTNSFLAGEPMNLNMIIFSARIK